MIPWLYDIFNVCVPRAGVNHNQSIGPQGLPGRPGFSPEKPALRAAGQDWYKARRPGQKTSGPARPGPLRTLSVCIPRMNQSIHGGGVRSANEPVFLRRVGLREWTGLSTEEPPPWMD